MARLLPILLALMGLAGGIGAGWILAPTADPAEVVEQPAPTPADLASRDYVRLNNQFIVPVVENGRIGAMVIISLSIEMAENDSSIVHNAEPKLRDLFLQVMFEHSNAGGFSGHFTQSEPMQTLRNSLREAAQSVLGPSVIDVLIIDMLRQDN